MAPLILPDPIIPSPRLDSSFLKARTTSHASYFPLSAQLSAWHKCPVVWELLRCRSGISENHCGMTAIHHTDSVRNYPKVALFTVIAKAHQDAVSLQLAQLENSFLLKICLNFIDAYCRVLNSQRQANDLSRFLGPHTQFTAH